MVRLTAELLTRTESYLNGLKDRELDLRGLSIPAIENLGVTRDQLDTLDLSDNAITSLSNLPHLRRLKTLYLANNPIASIASNLSTQVPFLLSLSLVASQIAQPNDFNALHGLKHLEFLAIRGSPAAELPHTRLWIIQQCPSIRFIDSEKVKLKERQAAKALFVAEDGTPTDLAKTYSQVSKNSAALESDSATLMSNGRPTKASRTFEPGQPLSTVNGQGGEKGRLLTAEERERVRSAIERAKSVEEVKRLSTMLEQGFVPSQRDLKTLAGSSAMDTSSVRLLFAVASLASSPHGTSVVLAERAAMTASDRNISLYGIAWSTAASIIISSIIASIIVFAVRHHPHILTPRCWSVPDSAQRPRAPDWSYIKRILCPLPLRTLRPRDALSDEELLGRFVQICALLCTAYAITGIALLPLFISGAPAASRTDPVLLDWTILRLLQAIDADGHTISDRFIGLDVTVRLLILLIVSLFIGAILPTAWLLNEYFVTLDHRKHFLRYKCAGEQMTFIDGGDPAFAALHDLGEFECRQKLESLLRRQFRQTARVFAVYAIPDTSDLAACHSACTDALHKLEAAEYKYIMLFRDFRADNSELYAVKRRLSKKTSQNRRKPPARLDDVHMTPLMPLQGHQMQSAMSSMSELGLSIAGELERRRNMPAVSVTPHSPYSIGAARDQARLLPQPSSMSLPGASLTRSMMTTDQFDTFRTAQMEPHPPPHERQLTPQARRINLFGPCLQLKESVEYAELERRYADLLTHRGNLRRLSKQFVEAQTAAYACAATGQHIRGWTVIGNELHHMKGVTLFEGPSREGVDWQAIQRSGPCRRSSNVACFLVALGLFAFQVSIGIIGGLLASINVADQIDHWHALTRLRQARIGIQIAIECTFDYTVCPPRTSLRHHFWAVILGPSIGSLVFYLQDSTPGGYDIAPALVNAQALLLYIGFATLFCVPAGIILDRIPLTIVRYRRHSRTPRHVHQTFFPGHAPTALIVAVSLVAVAICALYHSTAPVVSIPFALMLIVLASIVRFSGAYRYRQRSQTGGLVHMDALCGAMLLPATSPIFTGVILFTRRGGVSPDPFASPPRIVAPPDSPHRAFRTSWAGVFSPLTRSSPMHHAARFAVSCESNPSELTLPLVDESVDASEEPDTAFERNPSSDTTRIVSAIRRSPQRTLYPPLLTYPKVTVWLPHNELIAQDEAYDLENFWQLSARATKT
ncbi:hypothetical protein E5Q_04790 [Mixia osmundae IAM 14324]|uniref:U2 small nuclear ribonucleoprotein A' n=1 Tax=Mixia osmundae (strain CBS 9802 / IAM 14324 / JCM 22182 / KY 12970) TaxID=764103 RepID=G7E5J6_MIXOS|nr:hypothetical protein E5Q_04790 [Mixia osmundae IAM 14324]